MITIPIPNTKNINPPRMNLTFSSFIDLFFVTTSEIFVDNFPSIYTLCISFYHILPFPTSSSSEVLCQELFDCVSIGKYMYDLMGRDAGSFDASLPMANIWIDRNAGVYHILPPPRLIASATACKIIRASRAVTRLSPLTPAAGSHPPMTAI